MAGTALFFTTQQSNSQTMQQQRLPQTKDMEKRISKLEYRNKKEIILHNKGIINAGELIDKGLNTDLLENPQSSTSTTLGWRANYLISNTYHDELPNRKRLFCLTDGNIKPQGTVRYRWYIEGKIDTDIQLDQSAILSSVYRQAPELEYASMAMTSCWIPGNRFSLHNPEVGVVYPSYGSIDSSTVVIFYADDTPYYQFVTFKKNQNSSPSFFIKGLTDSTLFVGAESHGGGWLDHEIIKLNLKTQAFVNEDNCASIFPLSSANPTFDANCSAAGENIPPDAVSDYGFVLRQ